MAFPFEHGLHSTLIAMRLGDRLEVDRATASQTYFACLLMYSGCNTDAEMSCRGLRRTAVRSHAGDVRIAARDARRDPAHAADPGSPAPVRMAQIARRLPRAARARDPHMAAICEVAQMLSDRLGLPASVQRLFAYGSPNAGTGRARSAAPRARRSRWRIRIATSPAMPTFQRVLGGDGRRRPGRPRAGRSRLRSARSPAAWWTERPRSSRSIVDASVVGRDARLEPDPPLTLAGEEIDRALAAMGDFSDLLSPVPRRALGRRGGAGGRGGAERAASTTPGHSGPPRGAGPRPGAGRGLPRGSGRSRGR